MTKSERLLWSKNFQDRKRDKEIEEHVGYISKRVIAVGMTLVVVVIVFVNL